MPQTAWARAELSVMVECICSTDFMAKAAPSLPLGTFPEITVRQACTKDSDQHALCNALAKEICSRAGECNAQALRPFASIAQKLSSMRAHGLQAAQAQAATDSAADSASVAEPASFDLDEFMAQAGSTEPDGGIRRCLSDTGKQEEASAGEDVPKDDPMVTCPMVGNAGAESGAEFDPTYVRPVRDLQAGTISFQTRLLNEHLVCGLCMG